MDTVFSLAVPEPHRLDLQTVVADIMADVAMTESLLSVFRPDSEISRWRLGLIPDARLSAQTRAVMDACNQAEQVTNGLFSARRPGGYDPTGYVKGWALARAAKRMDDAGIASYCLNGGGDIIARGVGPTGTPWRLGVAHPYRPGEVATIVSAPPDDPRPIAVATSGTSQRGAHVSNPIDGWRPTRSAVTVVGHDIELADMAATAALAAGRDGREASARLVQRLGLEAFGFDEDQYPWWTPGMPRLALLPPSPSL